MKMNRIPTLLILILFISISSSAQIFEEFVPENRLPLGGSTHLGDFNNDGFMDVVYPGFSYGLALNDGSGSLYQDYQKPFLGFGNTISAIGDLDGDGDLDMVASTGYWNATPGSKVFRIYFNDGNGQMQLDESQLFQGLSDGGLEISDVDQDGDQDIFLTGIYTQGNMHSYLFINDGTGVFTMEQLDDVVAMCEGDLAFEDFTGDGYPDLIFMGLIMQSPDPTLMTEPKYYVNDGTGHFEEFNSYDLPNTNANEIGVFDIDADNDLDLVLADCPGQVSIHLNDGLGNFEEAIDLFEHSSYEAEIEFADIDNNGFGDIILIGANPVVYLNNGNYDFIEKLDHGLPNQFIKNFKLADLNNDGSQDIIFNSDVYYNDGTGSYQLGKIWFPNNEDSYIKTTDIDGDNDLDVLYFRNVSNSNSLGSIYLNNKADGFAYSEIIFQEDFMYRDATPLHLNGDAYEDLLVLSDIGLHYFINDTENNFVEEDLSLFAELNWENAFIEDLDADGIKDLILAGRSASNNRISFIYKGFGYGEFQYVKELNFHIKDIERVGIDRDDTADFAIVPYNTGTFSDGAVYTDLGRENIEEFFDHPDTNAVVFISTISFSRNMMEVVEDTTGSYLVLSLFTNKIDILKKGINNSFDSQFWSTAGLSVIPIGDINMDGYTEYIYYETISSNESIKTVANYDDGVFFNSDSIFAPSTSFYNPRDYIVEDFDLDGDLDLLLVEEYGAIEYLVNNTFVVSNLTTLPAKRDYLIYPNPAVNDLIYIEFLDENTEALEFSIYDKLGRVVKSGSLEPSGKEQGTISLSNLLSGSYILKIQQGGTVSSQAFIIQSK